MLRGCAYPTYHGNVMQHTMQPTKSITLNIELSRFGFISPGVEFNEYKDVPSLGYSFHPLSPKFLPLRQINIALHSLPKNSCHYFKLFVHYEAVSLYALPNHHLRHHCNPPCTKRSTLLQTQIPRPYAFKPFLRESLHGTLPHLPCF